MSEIFEIPVSEVEEGTFLQADGGFPCLPEGKILVVKKDKSGDLYVNCSGSRYSKHLLDGQLSDDRTKYVGLRKARPAEIPEHYKEKMAELIEIITSGNNFALLSSFDKEGNQIYLLCEVTDDEKGCPMRIAPLGHIVFPDVPIEFYPDATKL